MPIMPFEGLHDETLEDATGTDAALEPTHDEADERFYCDSILSGEYDEAEADHGDWREDTYDPDGWMGALDSYERMVYGE